MSVNGENRQAIKKPKDPLALKSSWETEVKQRLAAMQAFDPNATLRYRLNSESGSIDYMVGDDLAAKLAINGPLYEKSKQFVQSWSDLICLQEEMSASTLSLKMPLKSLLGDHFILESRIADDEEPTKSFALHFDRHERLVFFTALYQPFSERDQSASAAMSENQAKIDAILADLRARPPAAKGTVTRAESTRPAHRSSPQNRTTMVVQPERHKLSLSSGEVQSRPTRLGALS